MKSSSAALNSVALRNVARSHNLTFNHEADQDELVEKIIKHEYSGVDTDAGRIAYLEQMVEDLHTTNGKLSLDLGNAQRGLEVQRGLARNAEENHRELRDGVMRSLGLVLDDDPDSDDDVPNDVALFAMIRRHKERLAVAENTLKARMAEQIGRPDSEPFGRDNYLTESAYRICELILPEWRAQFLLKNADYGDAHVTIGLGARAEFVGMWRKMWLLRKTIWDGEEVNHEDASNQLFDLIGTALLILDLYRNAES